MDARNSERLVRPFEGAPRRRRTPSLILLAVLLAGAGAIAAGFLILPAQQSAGGYVPPDVLARMTSQTRSLAARLDAEPCNRTLALSVAKTLVEASEYRGMESLGRGFHQRCDTHQDLLPLLFASQMGLSDFAAARQTGDQLTQFFAEDPNSWAWRADAREKLGDFEGSFADLRRALALFADPSRVGVSTYYSVAQAAARAGRVCEAALIMRDFIAFDSARRRTQQIETLTRGWQTQGDCRQPFSEGSATVRFDQRASIILVSASVNGVPARLIVDTGASRTVLSESLARRAGIRASDQDGAPVLTRNGLIWLPGGRAATISVEGASARDVPVFIQREQGGLYDSMDGLLGLSFLGNFRTTLGAGMLELSALE